MRTFASSPTRFSRNKSDHRVSGLREFLAGRSRGKFPGKHSWINRPLPYGVLSDRVKEAANDPDRKIEAIKLFREETGAGLAEAKMAVEQYIRSVKS